MTYRGRHDVYLQHEGRHKIKSYPIDFVYVKDCLKGNRPGTEARASGAAGGITSLPPWLGRASDGGFGGLRGRGELSRNGREQEIKPLGKSQAEIGFSGSGGREVTRIGWPHPRVSTFTRWHTTDKPGFPTCWMGTPRLWAVDSESLLEARSWLKCQLLPSLILRCRMSHAIRVLHLG